MDKCPFWSTQNKIISCNEECPMYQKEEICRFQVIFNLGVIDHLNDFEEIEYVVN